jgi:type I restriction enzyme, S subunit
MSPKQLLAHFDRIAEAPGAVPRLRRFVRELAVRGRLVPQGEHGQPASHETVDSDYSSSDAPFRVPQSWTWVTVDAVSDARLGKMLDKAKNRGVPKRYLRNVNVRWFDFDLSDVFEMPFEDIELEEFSLRAGDVLICEGGEPGRAAVWDKREHDIYFQKAVHRLRFDTSVDPHFFVVALRESFDSGRLAKSYTGVGIKHLTGRGLASFRFPCPPLAEQQRIVAKVDELMALCDRLETAQAEREQRRELTAVRALHQLAEIDDARNCAPTVLANLSHLIARAQHIDKLRQSILSLAVKGGLVAQVCEGRVGSLGLTEHRRQFGGASHGLFAIPDHWQWVTIGQLLSEDSRNGCSRKPDDAANGVPILRISAGTARSDGLVAEDEFKLLGGVSAAERKQLTLRPGDLLACRFNGNRAFVGRLALYAGYSGREHVYPDKLIRLRVNPALVAPSLLRWFAQSREVRAAIESYCATTVGNWGISATNLKKVLVPLPPLPEQHRLVDSIEALMTICDRLEAQLATAQTQSARLLEAVLHQALEQASHRTVSDQPADGVSAN